MSAHDLESQDDQGQPTAAAPGAEVQFAEAAPGAEVQSAAAAPAAHANCPAGCYVGPYPSVPAPSGFADRRAVEANDLRQTRAQTMTVRQPVPPNPCNGDEVHLPNFIGSYSKGLKHDDQTGEVRPDAYCAFLRALNHKDYTSSGFPKVGSNYDAIEALKTLPNVLGCSGAAASSSASAAPAEVRQFNIQVSAADNQLRLVNPVAPLSLDLEGIDSHQCTLFKWQETTSSGFVKRVPFPEAPAFSSAEEIAEIAENYWMALTRDVPFTKYDTAITQDAAEDLSRYVDFKGPKQGGNVTPGTLFRGYLEGDLVGPYISQFLLRPIPYGAQAIDARIRSVKPVTNPDGTINHLALGGRDYLTNFAKWREVQNGCRQGMDVFDDPPRHYIHSGRDLGQYVHVDQLIQAYFNACLLLLAPPDPQAPAPGLFPALAGKLGGGLGGPQVFDDGNPYKSSKVQDGFGTLGGPDILVLLTEVSKRALKAVWYQKWSVHRRLRPEAFGGRIDVQEHNPGMAVPTPNYPFEPTNFGFLNTGVGGKDSLLERTSMHNQALNGDATKAFFLPMAFPEGSPLHPAYGAGHSTVAGACVTILKAFFKEDFRLVNLKDKDGNPAGFVPVVPSDNGLQLDPYTGTDANDLTVGGELNKLASNISIGRNIAGVHWRSDYTQSVRLGEAIAIWFLCDLRNTYKEKFCFSLTTFGRQKLATDPHDPTAIYLDKIKIENSDQLVGACFTSTP